MRCMHEASLHVHNCFVTLTYADAHLPKYGSLRKRDFQLFLKRLRKRFEPQKIRYFHCGEYGDDSARPHYHALFFGLDFPDKLFLRKRGEFSVYISPLLSELWRHGFHEIGSVTFESAQYAAKYCLKKVSGDEAHDIYRRVDADTGELVSIEPEYATMSRNPGIGGDWIKRFSREVLANDSVVVNGIECKPPRFYDDKLTEEFPEEMRAVKVKREKGVDEEEQTWERLAVKEELLERKHAHFNRSEV